MPVPRSGRSGGRFRRGLTGRLSKSSTALSSDSTPRRSARHVAGFARLDGRGEHVQRGLGSAQAQELRFDAMLFVLDRLPSDRVELDEPLELLSERLALLPAAAAAERAARSRAGPCSTHALHARSSAATPLFAPSRSAISSRIRRSSSASSSFVPTPMLQPAFDVVSSTWLQPSSSRVSTLRASSSRTDFPSFTARARRFCTYS